MNNDEPDMTWMDKRWFGEVVEAIPAEQSHRKFIAIYTHMNEERPGHTNKITMGLLTRATTIPMGWVCLDAETIPPLLRALTQALIYLQENKE